MPYVGFKCTNWKTVHESCFIPLTDVCNAMEWHWNNSGTFQERTTQLVSKWVWEFLGLRAFPCRGSSVLADPTSQSILSSLCWVYNSTVLATPDFPVAYGKLKALQWSWPPCVIQEVQRVIHSSFKHLSGGRDLNMSIYKGWTHLGKYTDPCIAWYL